MDDRVALNFPDKEVRIDNYRKSVKLLTLCDVTSPRKLHHLCDVTSPLQQLKNTFYFSRDHKLFAVFLMGHFIKKTQAT